MSEEFECGLSPEFPDFLQIPEAVNTIQAFIAMLSAAVGLPLNLFLLAVIIKYPALHQQSLFLSLQIIGIEILYHLTIPFTILISTISGYWVLGNVVCNVSGMIHDAFAMFRFTMTFVLTVDRFMSVYKPFLYFKHGKKISWGLSAIVWFVTLIRIILPLTGILDCFVYIPTFKTCTVYAGCSRSCEYFAAWSIGLIVLLGVVLPVILYAIIFCIIRRITRYHISMQDSVRSGIRRVTQVSSELEHYKMTINNRKKFVTASILFVSIIGTTPAFTLYMASIFYRTPNRVLFIVNMLVGRTSFNMIPVFDAIAFFRHRDIIEVTSNLYHSLKRRIHPAENERIHPAENETLNNIKTSDSYASCDAGNLVVLQTLV